MIKSIIMTSLLTIQLLSLILMICGVIQSGTIFHFGILPASLSLGMAPISALIYFFYKG